MWKLNVQKIEIALSEWTSFNNISCFRVVWLNSCLPKKTFFESKVRYCKAENDQILKNLECISIAPTYVFKSNHTGNWRNNSRIWMQHCPIPATDGVEFWINCKRPAYLSCFSPLQVIQNTMRTNLLNWCHLVSISKNVVFYAFLVVRIY